MCVCVREREKDREKPRRKGRDSQLAEMDQKGTSRHGVGGRPWVEGGKWVGLGGGTI